MKKKLLAMALCICTALSVASCGESDEKTEGELKLGEYKGIKVDATLEAVSQEEIDNYIETMLESHTETEEITEGVLAEGDTVKITYSSTVDGKEYRSGEGVSLALKEDEFNVDGFVEGIIGHNIGDEFKLDLVLPADFTDTANAGKDITFNVKIEAKLNYIVPEFTDEFVKSKFEYLGLATTADFTEYTENFLRLNQTYSEIWQEVLDNATVESYDHEKLEERTQEVSLYQEYFIYSNFGYELADYLSSVGMTEDEYVKQMEEYAKEYLKQDMVIEAIADAEDITVTEELYNQKMFEFAKSDGYNTVEEFEEAYKDSMTKEDFEFSVLQYLVEEFVCKNVDYVEGYGLRSEKETSSENSTEASTQDATEATTEATTEAATK